MQIVIDISEDLYREIKQQGIYYSNAWDMGYAIQKGVVLPKGHGRLIDENEAIKSLFDYNKGKKTIGQCINDAPTVLEKEDT